MVPRGQTCLSSLCSIWVQTGQKGFNSAWSELQLQGAGVSQYLPGCAKQWLQLQEKALCPAPNSEAPKEQQEALAS